MKKILLGLLVVYSVGAFAQVGDVKADFINYQDRQVYTDEANNVCTGKTPDFITLNIIINNSGYEEVIPQMKAKGGVTCDATSLKYRNKLNFGKSFGYYSGTNKFDKTEISFNDSVVVNKSHNVVMRASLSDNHIFINGKQYACTILGG